MHTNEGYICGLDEAGRGPLAGPVVAACVILSPDFPIHLLDDSKRLSEPKRATLETLIKEKALYWAIGLASAREIEQINILSASMLAMQRAYNKVRSQTQIAQALVDGNRVPTLDCPAHPIVKGDASIPPIMAASILAKQYRDHLMRLCGIKWPQYSFERHKGYPTKAHRKACQEHGLCPIHRRTFTIQGELF